MPNKMKKNLPAMLADDWLMTYKSLDGMIRVFDRFKHRLSRPELLARVTENLMQLDKELESDFQIFFPALEKHIHAKHHH